MSAIAEVAKAVKKDYEVKFETYLKAAHSFELIKDTEMFNICMKKAAGCKMMLDSGQIDKFIK